MPHGLDTGPANGLLEGSVLAQPSTQLTGRLMIERAPIKIELMGLDSRSSQRLPLTLLRGRPLPDPSLRAARSRGHRNIGSNHHQDTAYRRYEQPDQEGIETNCEDSEATYSERRYEQPDQEGIETPTLMHSRPSRSRRYEQPDQEGIETCARRYRPVARTGRYEQPDQEGIETSSSPR